MALEKYRAKRDFKVTPEPRGKALRKGAHDLAFVIQKHAASHLHYDFRLELNGVLLSWAVPKGPSLDPADKRLAMHVEDHPIEYGGFEGIIPEKQYGAGTVMLWDRGTWQPLGDPVEGYRKGNLKFTLDGEKLHGGWALIRTHSDRYGKGDKQAWLLIKERDEHAQRGGVPIVEKMPDSVATGARCRRSRRPARTCGSRRSRSRENVKAGAIALAPPKAMRVAKAGEGRQARESVRAPRGRAQGADAGDDRADADHPRGRGAVGRCVAARDQYDGYRMVARVERGKARLYSRTGKDWTAAFQRVADDIAKLPVKNAWVDGEVVVLDDEGRTSFQALQNALSGADATFVFFAFDLMYRDGVDLRKVALAERKRLLRETVGDGVGAVRVGPEVQGHGDEFFRQACSLSLEGAVCKRADSPYRDGLRTRDWVKGQVHAPAGDGDRRLHRAAGLAHRLRRADARRVRRREAALRGQGRDRVHRQDPGRHLRAAAQARARHAGVRRSAPGLRGARRALGRARPRRAGRVHRVERRRRAAPPVVPGPAPRQEGARGRARGAQAHAGGTHARRREEDRHEEGRREGDGAGEDRQRRRGRHDLESRQALLPRVGSRQDRHRALLRVDGAADPAVRREAPAVAGALPRRLERAVLLPEERGQGRSTPPSTASRCPRRKARRPTWARRAPPRWSRSCSGRDRDAPVGLAQAEARAARPAHLRLRSRRRRRLDRPRHGGPPASHAARRARPGRLPEDDGRQGAARRAADPRDADLGRREVVHARGRGFHGEHVRRPLHRDGVEARRKGKIFIDYLRNAEGATAIAPYAVRARAGAPVSMPIGWDELETDVRFDHFNVRNAAEVLARRKRDPWRDYFEVSQAITKAHRARVGL
jgi:DNA ligase D-like protein (predicted 3'-phosphoesterase)